MSDAFIVRRGGGISHKRLPIIEAGLRAPGIDSVIITTNTGSVTSNVTYGKNGYMELWMSGWAGGYAESYASVYPDIDLTKYKTLCVDLAMKEAAPYGAAVGVQSEPGLYNEIAYMEFTGKARQTIKVNISALTGPHTLFVNQNGSSVGTGGGNAAYVYNMWLER